MKLIRTTILLFLTIFLYSAKAQHFDPPVNFSYTDPEEYVIGDITFSGIEYLDPSTLTSIIGLKQGDVVMVPGEDISNALRKLWEQKLIGDVSVSVTKIEGSTIYLNFHMKERPRLSKITFSGVKKSAQEDLKGKMNISLGQIVTDAMVKNAREKILQYYYEKGFLNAQTNIRLINDTTASNSVSMKVDINRNSKVKIDKIIIHGNEVEGRSKHEAKALSDAKLKKQMKNTKENSLINILSSSKFQKAEFEKDKQNIINYYNGQGYRDARIVSDTFYFTKDKRINIELTVDEGRRYYFRNINWNGNYVHTSQMLDTILKIRKGDPYSLSRLEKNLNYNPEGLDISSLYLDDGYLFFHVDPVEVLVENDSIDIEMRIYEGPQATIRNVSVSGNTKTHDHVVLRELRTLPGQKFSRADLIRSQREIAALGYFDPEQIGVNPVPNPADGTVDINYTVAEKPSDQIELSGGWGGGFGLVGTLGVVFNNFSLRNVPKFNTWSPLPSGDGQRLSLRFQASGRMFQAYSFSFTEPWLGGKKPNALTFSLTHTQQSNPGPDFRTRLGYMRVSGGTVSLGRRLTWPDDYFTLSNSISLLQYRFNNFSQGRSMLNQLLSVDNGTFNNFTFNTTIARNNLNDFIFPTSGSNITFSVAATAPYSLFQKNRNWEDMADQDRYRFVEYHKWMFDNSWFTTLVPGKKRNLVANVRAHLGFVGSYGTGKGVGPFERFVMGGDGLSGMMGFMMIGTDIIGLRGYPNNQITGGGASNQGGLVYNKFVFEMRYPLNLSPALSVFAVSFFEAGNVWDNFKNYNPTQLYRSAGVGARVMMPAFGMIGIDWGYRLDDLPHNPDAQRSRFTFTIGQQIR